MAMKLFFTDMTQARGAGQPGMRTWRESTRVQAAQDLQVIAP